MGLTTKPKGSTFDLMKFYKLYEPSLVPKTFCPFYLQSTMCFSKELEKVKEPNLIAKKRRKN